MFIPAKEPVPNCAGPPTGSVLGWHGSARDSYIYTVSYSYAGPVFNQADLVSDVV